MPSPTVRAFVRPVSLVFGIAALLALILLVAGPLWRYSELIVGPRQSSTLHEQRVLAAEPGRVRLSRDRESLEPGVWALQWKDGFARIGAVLEKNDTSVVRACGVVTGQLPVGGWASLRGISRSANPANYLGLPFEARSFDGPLGSHPAWFVPGSDSTWAIYVHGIGANRAEGLRTLSVLNARGLPGLLITYRNDLDAPRSPDGLYHLGLTEWRDIEAAARYALAHGARDLVLASYSMGGHVTLQFLARSPLAARVRGVILEAPVLDWAATLDHRSRVLRVPAVATWAGKTIAAARAGLDWNELDFVHHHEQVVTPMLLFHGLHDTYVPVAVSEAYARARPGQVTFVGIEHGNHVDAWNADPVRYAADVNRWCAAYGIGRDAATPSEHDPR